MRRGAGRGRVAPPAHPLPRASGEPPLAKPAHPSCHRGVVLRPGVPPGQHHPSVRRAAHELHRRRRSVEHLSGAHVLVALVAAAVAVAPVRHAEALWGGDGGSKLGVEREGLVLHAAELGALSLEPLDGELALLGELRLLEGHSLDQVGELILLVLVQDDLLRALAEHLGCGAHRGGGVAHALGVEGGDGGRGGRGGRHGRIRGGMHRGGPGDGGAGRRGRLLHGRTVPRFARARLRRRTADVGGWRDALPHHGTRSSVVDAAGHGRNRASGTQFNKGCSLSPCQAARRISSARDRRVERRVPSSGSAPGLGWVARASGAIGVCLGLPDRPRQTSSIHQRASVLCHFDKTPRADRRVSGRSDVPHDRRTSATEEHPMDPAAPQLSTGVPFSR